MMKTSILFVLIILTTFTGCSVLGSNGDEDKGSGPRTILFSARNGGNYQIYAMREDGTGIKQLTTDSDHYATNPAWSPDGSRIAFESSIKAPIDTPNLYVMDADGSNMHPLVTNPHTDGYPMPGRSPAWSPNGTKLAFDYCPTCEGGALNYDIYVADLQAGTLDTLTHNRASDRFPTWSPDGKQIAFTSDRDYIDAETLRYRTDLYLTNKDGTDLKRLTDSGFLGSYTWTSNNTLVYVTYNHENDQKELTLLNTKTNHYNKIVNNLHVKQFWILGDVGNNKLLTLNKEYQKKPLTISMYKLDGKLLKQDKSNSSVLKSATGFDWKTNYINQ